MRDEQRGTPPPRRLGTISARDTRPWWLASVLRELRMRSALDVASPLATERALSRIGGAFYVSGGLVAVVTALVSDDVDHRAAVAVIGLIATAGGAVVAWPALRISQQGRAAMNLLGTAVVLVLVGLAGRTSGGEALFWLFCFVPVDSFLFFPWRWAVPMLAWGSLATGIGVFGLRVLTPVEWLDIQLVAVVVAATVGWLVRTSEGTEWDPGTDMLAARAFERALEARCLIAQRSGARFSLAAIHLGLAADDEVGERDTELRVRELARRWRPVATAAALWGRTGEAELSVLWTGGPGFDAYLGQVLAAAGPGRSVSIGVAEWRPGDTAVQLHAAALAGCGHSSRSGGDRISRDGLFTSDVEALRTAIRSGRVRPYFQPIVELPSGRIHGAEALARWVGPNGEVIPPDEFIPLAERSGLIEPLGRHVLREACRHAARWRPLQGPPLTVSVNVSGEQLHDPGFVDVVLAVLVDTGLPSSCLTLEVTESTIAGDDLRARDALSRLRCTGITVAIDDFGTGWSNLSRLATLPVDVVKLDRSFVVDAEDSPRARELLTGLVVLADSLGLRTVVEGVETSEQAAIVSGTGAVLAQGWLYGPPVPPRTFAAQIGAGGTWQDDVPTEPGGERTAP